MELSGCVVGHGVDAVDIQEFSRVLELAAEKHLDRYFTSAELACVGSDSRRLERLACRFALKEAVMKSLEIGWGDGVSFTDIEIGLRDGGAPTVVLHRYLSRLASERGIRRWLVSMSHTGSVAFASAIAVTTGIVPK